MISQQIKGRNERQQRRKGISTYINYQQAVIGKSTVKIFQLLNLLQQKFSLPLPGMVTNIWREPLYQNRFEVYGMFGDINHHESSYVCRHLQSSLGHPAATSTADVFFWICHAKVNFELVGGLNPSEKYESQLGRVFPIYGKIKFMATKPPTSESKQTSLEHLNGI